MLAQQRPNIALRSLCAVAVVSLLAGPVFQWLLIAISEPDPNNELPIGVGDIGFLFLYVFPVVSVIGLVGAVPASVINALLVAALAKRRIDGALPGIISAVVWAVIIPAIALHLFGNERQNLIGGEHTQTTIACLALTGVLLGIVHWLIAVRPYRVWRLQLKNVR
jgi:hypothetical protein